MTRGRSSDRLQNAIWRVFRSVIPLTWPETRAGRAFRANTEGGTTKGGGAVRKFAVCWLLLSWLAGCAGDSSLGEAGSLLSLNAEQGGASSNGNNGGTLPTQDRAGVGGVLVRSGGTVQFVGSASEAAGAPPAAGIRIRVLNLQGTEVGGVTTGPDGAFQISGLSGTAVELEANGVTLPVTLVDGFVVSTARPNFARQQAVDKVLAATPPTALVVATFTPLPPGTVVQPAFGNAESDYDPALSHTVASGGEFLVLVDPAPSEQFGHEVQFHFVNASSGVDTVLDSSWLPAVNDVLFFSATGQLVVDRGNGTFLSGMVVQIPPGGTVQPRKQSPPVTPKLPANPDKFAFLLTGTPENWYLADRNRTREWLENQGVPPDNIVESSFGTDLETPTERAQRIREEFLALAPRIESRAQAGGDPSLFVEVSAHGNPRGEIMLNNTLRMAGADRLNLALFRHSTYMQPIQALLPLSEIRSACHIKLLLSCCYAGSHIRRLDETFPADFLPDVEIFSSCGEEKGVGNDSILDFLRNPSVQGFGDFLPGTLAPLSGDGTQLVSAWTQTALMDGEGNIVFQPEPFVPFGKFARGRQRYFRNSADAPQVDAVAPLPFRTGQLITVQGRNLGGPLAEVRIAGNLAVVQSGNDQQLQVLVPGGALTGPISIRLGCHTSFSENVAVLRHVFTRYILNETFQALNDFTDPDVAFSSPDTGARQIALGVDELLRLDYPASGSPGTIDAAGNFQMSPLKYFPVIALEMAGKLLPDGAFHGTGLERYLPVPTDTRSVTYDWSPVEVRWEGQLVVNFARRYPGLTDPRTTFPAELTKTHDQQLTLRVYGPNADRFDFPTRQMSQGQLTDSLSVQVNGATMTLDNVQLQPDGQATGKFHYLQNGAPADDLGEFVIVPDTAVLLEL